MTCSNLQFRVFFKKNINHYDPLKWIGFKCFKAAEHPAGIYLLKVNNRNTTTRCEIKLGSRTGFFFKRKEWIISLQVLSL